MGKKMTTEEFIARAKEVHGDKYDYSKAEYKGADTKVCIICPIHGEFWQTPYNHTMKKQGCPSCSGNSKKTTEEFITEAKAIHGDKYDYSKVVYKNAKTKVIIICPLHGEFKQTPYDHIKSKNGCPKCAGKGVTTEELIDRANKMHNNKYDYSKVEWDNVKKHKKVTIICPIHGEFQQDFYSHLSGCRCLKCQKTEQADKQRMTKEEFIAKAREVHGDKYDYSKVDYKDSKTEVCIICPKHGEFWQLPIIHTSQGCGCTKCGKEKMADSQRMTKEEFIAKAREMHGDKYDYSKTIIEGFNNEVTIICPEHGEFKQLPSLHLKGCGCPNCVGYRKEYKFNLLEEFTDEFHLREFLMTNDENIIYIILRNIEKIEPKFNPIVKDIDRVLHGDSTDPIKDLEDKYRKPEEETTDATTPITTEEPTVTSIDEVDLDDDDAVEAFINNVPENEKKDEKKEPTIEDLTKARESEIKIINEIEHMLTPEDRQFIKDKFLNDRRRDWMLERDSKKTA